MSDEQPTAQVTLEKIFEETRNTSEIMVAMQTEMKYIRDDLDELKGAGQEARDAKREAEDALKEAQKAQDDLEDYKKQQSEENRYEKKHRITVISVIIPVIIFVLPMLIQFYI